MFWKRFPKKLPPKEGWYLCTINYKFDVDQNYGDIYDGYVMALFWKPSKKRFVNTLRQAVFDGYDVYGFDDDGNRVIKNTDRLVDRTDSVVAWKKMPRRYIVPNRLYYVKGG